MIRRAMRAIRWVGWLGASAVILWTVGCGAPPQHVQSLPGKMEKTAAAVGPLPTSPQLQAYVEKDGVPEYLIGSGDVLNITLRDVQVQVEKVTVRPDGNISFGLAEDIRAARRTVAELDAVLTAEMGRYLRHPKVDVEVVEFRSHMVSVLGALQAVITSGTKTGQGRYPLKGKTTVLDIILEAGGTTPDAQLNQVQLVRQGKSYSLDIQQVLATGDPTNNPILQGGDIVIVPGAAYLTKKVIVLGEVQVPNVYLFAEDASLLEALSRAGGLTGNALRDDIRLIRATETGPQMFTVNYERITNFADLQQNVALRNNDILYVPRSFMGDVNEVIAKVEPLLDLLLLPASYRDLYTTGGGLRLDTGAPPETGGTTDFTRALPGTAGKPVAPARESEEEENEK